MKKVLSGVQKQVQEAVDQLVDAGAERGLQVAVFRHGEQVVDVVAGTADPAGMPTKWALGYSIGRPGAMDSSSVFGIGGAGGSFAFGDTTTGVAFALTKEPADSRLQRRGEDEPACQPPLMQIHAVE